MIWTIVSYCHVRTSKEAHASSVCEQKLITYFQVCKQKHSYYQKLYIIPNRVVTQFCVSRSSVGSLEVSETGPENDVYSGFSSQNNFKR